MGWTNKVEFKLIDDECTYALPYPDDSTPNYALFTALQIMGRSMQDVLYFQVLPNDPEDAR